MSLKIKTCDLCGVAGGDHVWGCPELKIPTVKAECCTVWDMPFIVNGPGWGHCGLCGQVPQVVSGS